MIYRGFLQKVGAIVPVQYPAATGKNNGNDYSRHEKSGRKLHKCQKSNRVRSEKEACRQGMRSRFIRSRTS